MDNSRYDRQTCNSPWVVVAKWGFLSVEEGPFTEGVGEEIIQGFETEEEANEYIKKI